MFFSVILKYLNKKKIERTINKMLVDFTFSSFLEGIPELEF